MQSFRSFHTAEHTIEGVESMHMLREGQVKRFDGRDAVRAGKVRREPVRCRCLTEV
jgi:transposase-like protein